VLAGPIVKSADFLAQLAVPRWPSRRDVGEAVFLIASGLLKKAVIADYIGVNFVDRVFASPTLYSGFENLLAVYGYAFQIYGDFSGYTDIALGLGRLVGFRLPANFDAPYRAASVTDFWRRWHITLSNWLREYVFLPTAFALSRRVAADRVLGVKTEYWVAGAAAMLTWLVCGVWHGAAWGFIVWGGLHGLAVTAEKMTRWPRRMSRGRIRPAVARVVTFHVVCAAWVFFRADTLATAAAVFGQVVAVPSVYLLPQVAAGYPLAMTFIASAAILMLAVPRPVYGWARDLVGRWPLPAQSAALALVVWIVLQARSADIQPFVYFRF
jgi:D-alanyl-lipoteichoic acid acyltransferase DltB (MBOAT superfamily)